MTKPAAVAYFRTSSAANTGPDKDSERRQRTAVTAYAEALKFEVVAEFYDAAVSSADPVIAARVSSPCWNTVPQTTSALCWRRTPPGSPAT